MYKYKVSGKVEVNYSVDFSLYEKLYNLYYDYICFEKAIKDMVFELNNEFNQEVLASKLKSRNKTLQKSCSISDLSDTFPSNFISRTIYISDYEMTSKKEDLSEFIHEAEYKIHNMLMGILKLPQCKSIDTKIYFTYIENITKYKY